MTVVPGYSKTTGSGWFQGVKAQGRPTSMYSISANVARGNAQAGKPRGPSLYPTGPLSGQRKEEMNEIFESVLRALIQVAKAAALFRGWP